MRPGRMRRAVPTRQRSAESDFGNTAGNDILTPASGLADRRGLRRALSVSKPRLPARNGIADAALREHSPAAMRQPEGG